MFKTSFSKYLTAFIIILFLSFLALSGIVTQMVQNYAFTDTEVRLNKESSIVVDLILEEKEDTLEETVNKIAPAIEPMVNLNSDYDIAITEKNGKIIFITGHDEDGFKTVNINTKEGFGSIDISRLRKQINDSGDESYVYNGRLGGSFDGQYMIYAKAVEGENGVECYVMTLTSTDKEHDFVRKTRQVVINTSIGVMLGAIIVAFIITDRIVHPLKNMTKVVKKFARGDFSERVKVSKRRDEVTELGIAFNNMADSVESLEKMRNSFLANVSHDLRTPMTTISGFIDGINSGAIPPEKHEYYLGIISDEVHRLSRLVSQLLDVSRLESGERKFTYTDFDIAEVARIILISFEQKIEDKHLDVEFDAEFDGMYAFADKDAIHQVLYNLCHNAIKFASDGGKFRIKLSRATDTKLKVEVYNQGQPISDEDAKHIFDRFYKTDKSRGLDKSGVGLGLYICKTIIDAHDETIGIETVDDGSNFWFTIKEGTPPQKRKLTTLDINK